MKKLKLKRSNLKSPYYIKRFKNGTIIQTNMLIKPVVYVREYDLRNIPNLFLIPFGLEQALYVYVGHTDREYLSYRNCDIKAKYNARTSIHKDYISFLERYEAVLNQLKANDTIKDELMFKCSKVKYTCNSKAEAKELEKGLAGHYKWLQSFNDISEYNTYLLSDTDCIYKDYSNYGTTVLKLK